MILKLNGIEVENTEKLHCCKQCCKYFSLVNYNPSLVVDCKEKGPHSASLVGNYESKSFITLTPGSRIENKGKLSCRRQCYTYFSLVNYEPSLVVTPKRKSVTVLASFFTILKLLRNQTLELE